VSKNGEQGTLYKREGEKKAKRTKEGLDVVKKGLVSQGGKNWVSLKGAQANTLGTQKKNRTPPP